MIAWTHLNFLPDNSNWPIMTYCIRSYIIASDWLQYNLFSLIKFVYVHSVTVDFIVHRLTCSYLLFISYKMNFVSFFLVFVVYSTLACVQYTTCSECVRHHCVFVVRHGKSKCSDISLQLWANYGSKYYYTRLSIIILLIDFFNSGTSYSNETIR